MITRKMYKTLIPISFTVLFTIGLLFAGSLGKKLNFEISINGYINGQFNYQIILLLKYLQGNSQEQEYDTDMCKSLAQKGYSTVRKDLRS